jgi:hypothetical protein
MSERRDCLDWDFVRAWLPGSVAPGESATVEACFHLPTTPGRYLLRLDMVDEGVSWFEQRGSPVLEIDLLAEAS